MERTEKVCHDVLKAGRHGQEIKERRVSRTISHREKGGRVRITELLTYKVIQIHVTI